MTRPLSVGYRITKGNIIIIIKFAEISLLKLTNEKTKAIHLDWIAQEE